MESLIGKTIDNYRILEVVGRGGMGVVLKALDTSLEKIVALKMIDPFLARDENFVRRFKTEAKALAKLENPNIVTVHALRETESGFFMVMEYVESKTLSHHISEKGAFSITESIAITKQILNAICHAHKVGVIHRDIKPNNVLLCYDGKIKVMDFGLAKVTQQQGPASTVAQTRAGTLYYMSPEQVKGLKNVDTRSDIYSIGMTIYEMVTGRVPFEKTDSDFTIQKHIVDGEIPSPAIYKPDIPKPFLKLILKAIEKDPAKRYQNVSEMEEALAQIEKDISEKSKETNKKVSTNIVREKSPRNKNKILIASLSAILLIAVTIMVYLSFKSDDKETTTNDIVTEDTTKQAAKDNEHINNIKEDIIPLASLTIKSNPPGAAVFLDGVPQKGFTDLYIDSLEIKDYFIVLVKKGYEEFRLNYKPSPGENNTPLVTLTPITPAPKPISIGVATLNLKMDEDGYIFIDNKKFPVNANELLSEKVSEENHLIKFENKNGLAKETKINVGKQKELTCYFQHKITIQTLDENESLIWASIIIDDKSTGLETPAEKTLSAGTYKIFVRREGYRTLEEPKIIKINPEFSRKPIPIVFHIKKL